VDAAGQARTDPRRPRGHRSRARWRTQLDIVVARQPRLAEYEVKAQRRIPILRIDRHAAQLPIVLRR
jgi:hypothetical protein